MKLFLKESRLFNLQLFNQLSHKQLSISGNAMNSFMIN